MSLVLAGCSQRSSSEGGLTHLMFQNFPEVLVFLGTEAHFLVFKGTFTKGPFLCGACIYCFVQLPS